MDGDCLTDWTLLIPACIRCNRGREEESWGLGNPTLICMLRGTFRLSATLAFAQLNVLQNSIVISLRVGTGHKHDSIHKSHGIASELTCRLVVSMRLSLAPGSLETLSPVWREPVQVYRQKELGQ